MIGRVQIKPDNIAHLLDEKRIGGEPETSAAMRLHCKGAKQAVYGGPGQPMDFRRLTNAPVGASGRLALQCAPQ
jgi:hypothetical protein